MELYSNGMERIQDDVMDPDELHRWKNEGAEVLSRCFSDALTSNEPVPLLTAALLMPLREATVEELIAKRVTALAASANTLYVNGVTMASPAGLVRSNRKLAIAMALHSASHLVQLHDVLVSRRLRQLKEQGVVGDTAGVTEDDAWRIANLVMDALPDSLPVDVSTEIEMYSHPMMAQYRTLCRKSLSAFVDRFCSCTLTVKWVENQIADRSMPAIDILESIVCAAGESNAARAATVAMSSALSHIPMHFLPVPDDSPDGIETANTQLLQAIARAGKTVSRTSALSRYCARIRLDYDSKSL